MIRCDWVRTIDATQEPITLSYAKQHSRALMDISDEDGLFVTWSRTARQVVEQITNRASVTQSWKFVASEWADEFTLPMAAPLQSITSVKYYAADGTLTTLSSSYYTTDTVSEPGRLVRAPNKAWPALQGDRLSYQVEITYVAGWTSVASIPDPLKAAMLMLVAHYYENRGAVQLGVGLGAVTLPFAVDASVGPYKVAWRPPVCA